MACCSQFTSSTAAAVSARAQAQRPQRHLLLPPLLQPISRPPSSRASLKLVAPLFRRRDQTTPAAVARASPEDERGVVPSDGDDGEGVSLGTMKLPPDTDLQRFETLLFQVRATTTTTASVF